MIFPLRESGSNHCQPRFVVGLSPLLQPGVDLQPQVEFPDPISACYLSDVFRTAAQLHTSLRHDRCPIKGGRVLLWYQTSQWQYLDRTILALPAERNLAESQSKCHVAVACSEERIFDLLCTQIQVLVRNLTSWPYWPAQAGK